MPSKKKSRQKKILLSIPLGETKVFSCENFRLLNVTPSDKTQRCPSCCLLPQIFRRNFSQQHGCWGVEMASSTKPFFSNGGNFVDGVYIIDIYNIYKYLSFVRPGILMYRHTVERFPTTQGALHVQRWPFRSSCMGARVPRIPKGKDISGHCIEDGFQRHLNIRAANKELQSRKHWVF